MPERDQVTHDGLSAVRAVRPRLLVVLLAAVVLPVLAVVLVIATRGSVRAQPVPDATTVSATSRSPTPATPTPTPPASPVPDGNDDGEVASSAVAPGVDPVAVRFTDAWLRPGTEVARLAALRPVCTLALARELAKVDPNRLPTGVRVGTPDVLAAGPFHARVRQALNDGSSIVLDLVPEVSVAGSRWLVASVRPGEPG